MNFAPAPRYETAVAACAIYGADKPGFEPFKDLGNGWEATKLPIICTEDGGPFAAHCSPKRVREVLAKLGLEEMTVEDWDIAHKLARHIEPEPLPALAMMRTAGVDPRNQAMVEAFRVANMMGREWAIIADDLAGAELVGWDGADLIDDFGKHWCFAGATKTRPAAPLGMGRLYGWWTLHAALYGIQAPGADKIQSIYEHHDEEYSDDSSTFHGKRLVGV